MSISSAFLFNKYFISFQIVFTASDTRFGFVGLDAIHFCTGRYILPQKHVVSACDKQYDRWFSLPHMLLRAIATVHCILVISETSCLEFVKGFG